MSKYADILNAARRNGTLPTPVDRMPRPQVWTPDNDDAPEPPRPLIVPQFQTISKLVNDHARMREPIIDGLLRRGETMNVIGSPKIGKSWATTALALCVQTGRPVFGRFETIAGNVLIVDNELHSETSANRIPAVAAAMGIPDYEYAETLCVENLRGRLLDIFAMAAYFDAIEPGRFDLIVLDAFYRFQPGGASENDNASMSRIYNAIDRFADRLGCAFVLIHHASKGGQADKAVTDVGAGAGAMSRAADSHLVMRPHEEDGCVVVDAVARSWPPMSPFVLRWEFPVFTPDESLDPEALKRQKSPSEQRQTSKDKDRIDRIVSFLGQNPRSTANRMGTKLGIDPRTIGRLLGLINETIHREPAVVHGNKTEVFSLIDGGSVGL